MNKVLLKRRALEEARNNFYMYNSSINVKTEVSGIDLIAKRLEGKSAIKTVKEFTKSITEHPISWYGKVVNFYKKGNEVWETTSPVEIELCLAKDIDVYLKDIIMANDHGSGSSDGEWIGFCWIVGIVNTIDYDVVIEELITKLIDGGIYEDHIREKCANTRLIKNLLKTN